MTHAEYDSTTPPETRARGEGDEPRDAQRQPTESGPRPRAGRIALIVAIILTASSVILSIVTGILGAPFVDRAGGGFTFNFQFGDPRPVVSALGMIGPLHVVVGSLVGVWIIVQSIVAIAAGWGRTAGIVALILGVAAPIVSFVVFMVLLITLS